MAAAPCFTFSVQQGEPELVAPAKPTPYEFKTLSDIDDQEGLRFYRSGIYFYRHDAAKAGEDPARVLKAALAEALVHYYPLAGRIREIQPTRKLVVECTGEGAVFVEADADVRLEDFGGVLSPPVPCYEKLVCETESATGVVVDRPLLYVQVTRMRCGGFIFGFQICHCMADASGLVQFLMALSEFARGVPNAPSVQPVWERELFTARRPLRVMYKHREYEYVANPHKDRISPTDALVHQPFFFGRREIDMLRSQAPLHLRAKSSRFDLVATFMWQCRAAALGYDPDDEVRLQFVVNARGRNRSRPVPKGFYGNAFAFAVASSAAGELCRRPFSYALQLVADAKERALEEEYLQSVADLMVARGRPRFTVARTYVVSDLTRARVLEVDVGWGKAVYGGPATAMLATFHMEGRNEAGEEGIEVPMKLPAPAMEKLRLEVKKSLKAASPYKMVGRDGMTSGSSLVYESSPAVAAVPIAKL